MILKYIIANDEILSKYVSDYDVNFICSLINPSYSNTSFIYQIISNNVNSIDVDKFDYITRDNFMLGFKMGFDPARLVNLNAGKTWRVSSKNRNTVGLHVSVNNVFDVTYKAGGFEQARNANYTELAQDRANGNTFGSKYFYGYGRTYFVNLYYNF